jgi:AcrR family transcriptional regulator
MTDSAVKKPRCRRDLGRQARRREQILDGAARLFARDGYSEADMQVLADTLHVGKGTLYRYFASKRDLFLAAVERVLCQLRQRIDASTAAVADPLDRIAQAIRTCLGFCAEHPEFVELLIQERAHFKDRTKLTYFENQEEHVERWRAVYRGLIAEGRVRDMPVERITDVVSDLLYGTMFINYFNGQRKPVEEQARDIIDVVFLGILSEPERRRDAGARARPGGGGGVPAVRAAISR